MTAPTNNALGPRYLSLLKKIKFRAILTIPQEDLELMLHTKEMELEGSSFMPPAEFEAAFGRYHAAFHTAVRSITGRAFEELSEEELKRKVELWVDGVRRPATTASASLANLAGAGSAVASR